MPSISSKIAIPTPSGSGSSSSSTLESRSSSPQPDAGGDSASQHEDLHQDPHAETIDALKSGQASKELDLHAEIWTGTRVAREAANPDSYVTVHGGGLATLGLQNLTLAGSADGGTATLSIDRAGVLARGTTEVDGHTISGAGGLVAANSYGEMVIHTGAHDNIALGTLNGRNIHGGGFTATQGTATMAVNEGIFVVGNAKQEAEVKEASAEGKVKIAFTDKKMMGMQITAAASHGLVGAGLRGWLSRDNIYRYTTWMSPQEASPAFQNQSFVNQKLRSIGVRSAKRLLLILMSQNQPLRPLILPC